MTQSTSFAQMANNQSISLSSALRANTPPTKGQTTSRKFLTLSIFLLLSFFTTNLWAADVTLSSSTVTNNKQLAYNTEWTHTSGDVVWFGYCYTDAKNRRWIQLKKDQGVYIKITTPNNTKITKLETTITGTQNTSGGIDDIAKHPDFSGRIALLTADATGSTSMTGVAYTTTVSNDIATLNPSGNNNTLYLKVSGGARIWSMTVTYEDVVCTTNPTVSAGSHDNVTTTTATVSCPSGITSLGSAGCSITSYGFVYGTSSNPTISNTKVQVGTTYATTGTAFTKELTGLTANTTYYVRLYATNGNGTAYGTQTSFTTPALPKYTVTLKDNDEILTQASAGESVTLPPRDGCAGYTFVGWTKTWSVDQTTWTTTAPTIIPTGSYTPTANENLYPVYTKTEGGGASDNVQIMNAGGSLNSNWQDDQKRNNGIQSYADKSAFQMYGETNNAYACELTSQIKFTNITGIRINVAANNANTVYMYYSADGETWTTWENNISVSKNTSSYTDYDFNMTNFPSGSYYICLSNTKSSMYMYSVTITSNSSTTYYISVPDCGTPTPTPTLNVDPATLTFENTTTNTSTEKTFTLTGSDLTANAALALSGTNESMFSVNPTSVTPKLDGTIDQTITVTYTPTAAGEHTATLTISSTGAESKTVTLSGTGVAPAPTYTITWKVNGEEYTEGGPTTNVVQGNAITHLPTAPAAPSGCSEKVFVGWSETNLGMELGQSAPTDLFTTAPATLITAPKIYHAVFADVESGGVIPTLPTAIAYWGKQEITENTGIPAKPGMGTMTSNVSLSSNSNRTYYNSNIGEKATITLSGLNLTSYDDITLTFWARGSAKGDITITTDLSNEVISTVTLTGTEVLYKINNIPNTATSITLTYNASSGSFFFGTVKLMETETTTYSFTKLTSENTNGWTGQDWNGYYLITNSQPDPDLKALDGNAIGEKLYQSVTDNDGVIQSIISSAFLVSYNSTEN